GRRGVTLERATQEVGCLEAVARAVVRVRREEGAQDLVVEGGDVRRTRGKLVGRARGRTREGGGWRIARGGLVEDGAEGEEVAPGVEIAEAGEVEGCVGAHRQRGGIRQLGDI